MDRRQFLRTTAAYAAGSALLPSNPLWSMAANPGFTKADFGKDFKWGVASAAYQIEGAWNEDGKGESIWDHFTHFKNKKIKTRENGDQACDYYHRYKDDIALIKEMNFDVSRFSIGWSRVIPQGIGSVNSKGIDFYHRVIDTCLEKGLEPWVTLYHWDLPQALQEKGGWANRDILNWFTEYTDVVTRAYGDKVKNWMILNEPMAFTGLGYLIGQHAPGYMKPKQFLQAAHHATMSMGESGRVVRANVKDAKVGTTFSCSYVQPKDGNDKHAAAAHRLDVLVNRLYIEPVLGMPYPTEHFKFLNKIHRYVKDGDMEKAKFDFDFIGIQNYTRILARKALLPFVWANDTKPADRGIQPDHITEMGWEVYPDGIYKIIKQFAAYKNMPPIIVTENGCAFPDKVESGKVADKQRIAFFEEYLSNVLKAKREGVDIRGYFVWTLMDNFEWAEGYRPRFGLVHNDFATQKRVIKDSGLWFKEFLK